MSENTEKPKSSPASDEIDLRELFSGIGNFFESIYNFFISVIIRFRKITISSLKLISIVIILSIAIGIALKKKVAPFYESEMIFQSPHLNLGISNSIFDKLNSLAEERNYEALAKVLKISQDQAKQIKGISASPFLTEEEVIEFEILKEKLVTITRGETDISTIIKKLEYENTSTYKIKVQVFEPSIINDLEIPLITFLKSNQYIKKRIEIGELNRNERKKRFEIELMKLDTLRTVIQKSILLNMNMKEGGSNNIFLGDKSVTDPLEIVNQTIRRFDELQEIEREIYLESDFEVIDTFVSFEKPAGTGLVTVIFYSLAIGLVIAYSIVLIKEFNTYLNKIENEMNPEV